MIVLDTSSLIRFFTNDNPSKAKQIKLLLENQSLNKFVPDVVFPELEYVLSSTVYKSSRTQVLKAFKFLISKKGIKTSREIKRAVELYESTKLDMADSIIAAAALTRKGKLASFDSDFRSIKELKRI